MKKHILFLALGIVALMASCGPREPEPQAKVLPGRFAIADGVYVRFSPGNLQYQASTSTWRFANVQYEMVGEQNNNISAANEGWIDLFGWGTSGNEGLAPYTISTVYSDYIGTDADIASTLYDWGLNNAIFGAGKAGDWFTLSEDEWAYLLKHHTTGLGKVEDVLGLIILPEDWEIPYDCDFTKGTNYSKNNYTDELWSHMEENGAVFLPAAGYRHAQQTMNVGSYGFYWTSTAEGSHCAYHLYFGSGEVNAKNANSRINGYSVRLVQKL